MSDIQQLDPLKTYNYLYRFEVEFYVPNKDISILPMKILYAVKDSTYLTNFMPTLKMEMLINTRDTFILKKYQDEVLSKITLVSYKYNTRSPMGENAAASGELVDTKIEFSEVFEPIFDKSTFPAHLREEEHEDDRLYAEDPKVANIATETMHRNIMCNFFNLRGITLNKGLFNAVLADTSVGSTILFILSNSGVKRAIIDPPTNTSEYTNIIVPPHNLRSSIEELQARYGIYENGVLIFYDFNTLYILDRFAQSHEFEKGDSMRSIIQVYEADINPQLILDIFEDKDNTLIYDATILLERFDSSIASGEIEGNSFMFSNYKMGVNSVIFENGQFKANEAAPAASVLLRDTDTHKSSGEKTILDYDELSNPYNMASYFNATETLKNQYHFSLAGVNIQSFKPNKFIQLRFENVTKNKTFGGSYTMLRNILSFEPANETSSDLICNADIHMAKRNKPT